MKSTSQNQWEIFKGAGWLLGVLLSIVEALVVFTLSESFTAAIAAALPIGIFAGLSLEDKFQRGIEQTEVKKTKIMIGSILFGFIIFISLYIIFELYKSM